MRPLALACVLLGLGACRGDRPPDEAVLTLVPTAMRATGGVAPASNDPNAACLIAGGAIAATIAVAGAPVTVIVIAFTPTPATAPGVEIRVGAELVATDVITAVAPRVLAYNVGVEPGDHVLRVSAPDLSPGILCVQSVAITQR